MCVCVLCFVLFLFVCLFVFFEDTLYVEVTKAEHHQSPKCPTTVVTLINHFPVI